MSRPSETFPWLNDANLRQQKQPKEFAAMHNRLQRRAVTEEQQQAASAFLLGLAGARSGVLGSLEDLLEAVQPGQVHSPTRLGLDTHPLFRMRHPAGQEAPPRGPADMMKGLEDEEVLGVAASSYFSAAVTSEGEVWTFGACFNGSLGGESNWSTSARRVAEPLATMLKENGGAVAVAAGVRPPPRPASSPFVASLPPISPPCLHCPPPAGGLRRLSPFSQSFPAPPFPPRFPRRPPPVVMAMHLRLRGIISRCPSFARPAVPLAPTQPMRRHSTHRPLSLGLFPLDNSCSHL